MSLESAQLDFLTQGLGVLTNNDVEEFSQL